MQSFEEASEFLEEFLQSFGCGSSHGDEVFPASGELLFRAFQSWGLIERFVDAKEPQIIQRLGDRREKFESDQTLPLVQLPGCRYQLGIECIGRTSHSCGVLVMLNLINEAIPADDPARAFDESKTWETLTNTEKERFALCEQSFSTWGGANMLADGVEFERSSMESAARDSRASWTEEQEAAAKQLVKDYPGLSQKEFNLRLKMNSQRRNRLWHHIKGTTPATRDEDED